MRQVLVHIPILWLQIALVALGGVALILVATGWKFPRNSSGMMAGICGGLYLLLHVVRTNLRAASEAEVLPIFGFGMMLFLAFVATSWLAQRLAVREGIDPDRIADLALWMFLGGIVGARLMHIVLFPAEFNGLFDFFKVWNGGLVFYGGVAGAVIVFFWYTSRHHLPVPQLVDVAAPPLALGIGIGRIGCLLNGCCWGNPSDVAWGIKFPAGSIPWKTQIESKLSGISPDDAWSLTTHPTQIYLSLAGFLLLAAMLAYLPHRRRHGELLVLLMFGYAVTRFVIEFFRADEAPWADHLTTSQNISVAIFIGGFVLWRWLLRTPLVAPPALAKTSSS